MQPLFWKGKKVFITGNTGFKGSWLCKILLKAGAQIIGYSLPQLPTEPNLYSISKVQKHVQLIVGDVRDCETLQKSIITAKPDIIIHMAAQALVGEGYANPISTWSTNVMGTIHILDALRFVDKPISFLNVTTDKVYENREWEWGYREIELLGGADPYSASKACSELATASFRRSFFRGLNVAISSARAGNVIGGGDFAKDRIIPDCIRAALNKEPVLVRNPKSVRPYQHVLEPLAGYMVILQRQSENPEFSGAYNIGPEWDDCLSTGELVDLFGKCWKEGFRWVEQKRTGEPPESMVLRLDCSKMRCTFEWKPRWRIKDAILKTVEWAKTYAAGMDISCVMDRQIDEYFRETDND